ncbi:hypothetical protein FQZ97_762900 [compost metagenome]
MQVARGGLERAHEDAVAGGGRAGVDVEGEAVLDERGGGDGQSGAVAIGQTHDGHIGAREAQFVVRRHQGSRVAHVGAHHGVTRVGRVGFADGGSRGDEEVLTRIALHVDAQRVLVVHRGGRGQRHAAQLVLHRCQVLVQEVHQAREFTAAQRGVGQRRRHAALHEGQGNARVVGGVGCDGQLVGALAQHQRLAAGHKHAHRAVLVGDRAGLDVLAEFAEQLVALVVQVVGGVRITRRLDDLLVHLGQVLRQAVDHVDRALHLLLCALGQRIQLAGGVAQAAGELLALGDHDHAGGEVAGRRRHVGPGVEGVVERRAQATGAQGKGALECLQARVAQSIGRGHGAGHLGFAREVGAVRALHRGDLHALAEEAVAHLLVTRRLLDHVLARIAGRVDVGDVVADDVQGSEVGVEGAGADVQR